jgi:predicted CXXCH cytochrome family protein
MESCSLKRRPVKGIRISLLALLVLSAHMALKANKLFAEETLEHPFIEKKDIRSETCLTCHPEKKDAKFVHTAIGMGCESCHHVVSRDMKTTITLLATGGELCAKCHEAKIAPVLHWPYKAGRCLICHDPHTGAYPNQLRGPQDTLCLSCHGTGQSNVKVNPENKLVVLLGDQTVSLDEYRQAPKLSLDNSGTSGHPTKGHPLSGRDPRKKGATMSCLSCHDPHSSALPNLMPAGLKSQRDLCTQCHK